MDILRQLTDPELERAYDSVFREAFPPEELKPLGAIRAMTRGGFYRPCGLFRDGEAVGYAFLWTDGPYILIDYLCVPRNIRNGGVGAAMIKALREAYPPETVFIGEVEAPTGDEAADAIIHRRLGFYERSGAVTLGYDTALFGVHYKPPAWSAGPGDEAEVLRRHEGMYRRWFPAEIYARAVQIPLRPGEKPFDRAIWDERPDQDRRGDRQ